MNLLVLGTLAVALVWSARRFSRASLQPHYVIAPAVFAFGLIATYHREADGMLLLLLLPLLFFRLHNDWRDLWAWGALALLIAGSLGPSLDMLRWLSERNGIYAALRFLALRQAAIVNLSLTIMLIGALNVGSRNQDQNTQSSSPFSSWKNILRLA